MSTKIELHLLQSFPPANLNRDDTNTPKDCEFGGVRRARISSQCFKRSIRLHPDFALLTGAAPAKRTRRLMAHLSEALESAGKPKEEAAQVAHAFTEALLGGMDDNDSEKSKVLFYISEAETAKITQLLTIDWEKSLHDCVPPETEDKKKKPKKDEKPFAEIIKAYRNAFSKRCSAPDIAMFGRMLAEDPELNMDAACQVAHAISTHKVNMETDYYTAVDDLKQEDTSGAGMVGLTSFNSATYYRYAAIDWEQLKKNLNGDVELARCTVQGFIRAAVRAIPTGKQTNFAAQTPPAFFMVVVRKDGQAWSLANAFERPVSEHNGSGYLTGSVQALVQQWQRLDRVYSDPQNPAHVFVLAVDETLPIAPFESEATLFALEGKVLNTIEEG